MKIAVLRVFYFIFFWQLDMWGMDQNGAPPTHRFLQYFVENQSKSSKSTNFRTQIILRTSLGGRKSCGELRLVFLAGERGVCVDLGTGFPWRFWTTLRVKPVVWPLYAAEILQNLQNDSVLKIGPWVGRGRKVGTLNFFGWRRPSFTFNIDSICLFASH